MAAYNRVRKDRPPLNAVRLRDLALHYVGRYATSKARLVRYLARKIGEVGWADDEPSADLAALAQEFEDLGYISDSGYAQMRANGLSGRGYGHRRIEQDLRANGIEESVRAELLRIDDGDDEIEDLSSPRLDAVDRKAAAITFARRKRIGPFARTAGDADVRRKHLAQMLRAGHDFDIARQLVNADPDRMPDL